MEDSNVTLRPYLINQCICLDKAEYEIIRNSILKHLLAYGAMTPDKLGSLVGNHLKNKFDCAIYQNYESVLQMLEARGEIRYVPGSSPPLIDITG